MAVPPGVEGMVIKDVVSTVVASFGGGVGGAEPPRVRKEFPETWLWNEYKELVELQIFFVYLFYINVVCPVPFPKSTTFTGQVYVLMLKGFLSLWNCMNHWIFFSFLYVSMLSFIFWGINRA